jgi:hypothetical protein
VNTKKQLKNKKINDRVLFLLETSLEILQKKQINKIKLSIKIIVKEHSSKIV